jgi:hypothetical protein
METLRVRVTAGAGWYSSEVGEIFDVHQSETFFGKVVYFIIENNCVTKDKYIEIEDCTIIPEQSNVIKILKQRQSQSRARMKAAYKNKNMGRYPDMQTKSNCVGELIRIINRKGVM